MHWYHAALMEWGVVQTKVESPSQQIVSKSEEHPLDGQALSQLCCTSAFTERFQLMYSIGHPTTTTWDNMAPSPLSDTLVCKTNEREREVGECKLRPTTKNSLNLRVMACWKSSLLWTRSGAPFLVRTVSGLVTSEYLELSLQL